MGLKDKNKEDLEINEFSLKKRKQAYDLVKTLKPDINQFYETKTSRIFEDKTVRVGQSEELTIVNEFWEYYSQFNERNLPDENHYMGGEQAELKISILINLFGDFYRNNIYPVNYPGPIIKKNFDTYKKPVKLYVVGDTHGSFIDTIRMIPFFVKQIEKGKREGFEVKIVFLGDYIDRGKLDIHNLLYIMTFNLKYKTNVLMLRGNHEEISICGLYGFGDRVIKNFSRLTFASFTDMFTNLPLICQYYSRGKSVILLHGGIPLIPKEDMSDDYEVPNLGKWEFNNRQLFLEDMDNVSQQILWNDPILNYNPEFGVEFLPNRRGIGYTFGKRIFNEFCEKHNAQMVIRGHQVFREGIKYHFDNKLITIFSASDYVSMQIDSRIAELNSGDNFLDVKVHRIAELSWFDSI